MLSRILALALILSFSNLGAPAASAADYCLAIRGNGELEPAHWGAISRVVESLGLPKAQAGGSSASISMFLLDAVASNPALAQASVDEQRSKASLLVKSFEGFASYLMGTAEFRDFKLMYSEVGQLKDLRSLEQIQTLLTPGSVRQNAELIRSNLNTALELGLLSHSHVERLQNSLRTILASGNPTQSLEELKRSRFYVSELIESIHRLGAFDADRDSNLFFRPSVVDFEQFAVQVGRVGDFYANADFSGFLQACTASAKGHLWSDLIQSNPECGAQFNALITTYFKNEQHDFLSRLVGQTIPSYPSTAVLTNTVEVSNAFVRYNNELSPTFGDSFHVQDPETVRFGYWGREDGLARMQKNLPSDDEKSRRFMALGRVPWQQVLSLSPAEPGLSPLKFFKQGSKTLVSAGGWADLHPVLVLKANGCQNVVYVTRRGGEAVFAQGVARRLLGFSIGSASDTTSLWARLYNVNNPQSSFKRALAQAAAVLCTQWDSFSLKEGMHPMIADAYAAPFQIPSLSGLSKAGLTPRLDPGDRNQDGSPAFLGCY